MEEVVGERRLTQQNRDELYAALDTWF
jgi:hypothetical protein